MNGSVSSYGAPRDGTASRTGLPITRIMAASSTSTASRDVVWTFWVISSSPYLPRPFRRDESNPDRDAVIPDVRSHQRLPRKGSIVRDAVGEPEGFSGRASRVYRTDQTTSG